MSCCAYSCTQYGLYTQYMHLTHADVLLYLQLHTVRSVYTVHASNPCWYLAVPTAAHSTVSTHTVYASNRCWCLAVPTAALCRDSNSFKIVRFSSEQPLHNSQILLKYEFRFYFLSQPVQYYVILSDSQRTKFNLWAMKFTRPTDVKLATKFLVFSLCVPYLSSVPVTNDVTVPKYHAMTVQSDRQRKVGLFYDST